MADTKELTRGQEIAFGLFMALVGGPLMGWIAWSLYSDPSLFTDPTRQSHPVLGAAVRWLTSLIPSNVLAVVLGIFAIMAPVIGVLLVKGEAPEDAK